MPGPSSGRQKWQLKVDLALDVLRNGGWLTRERIRLVAIALLFASTAGFLYLVVTAHGAVDLRGRPLGTDFSNVYAAGTNVLDGNAASAFDPVEQYARERAIFGTGTQFYGWHYPPFFLFVAVALALMPYGLALAVWQAVTLGLYLLAIRAIVTTPLPPPAVAASPSRGNMKYEWLIVALAFPAVLINVGHGQNGFLTAALIGGALVLLDRRPLVAGILLGCLVYKPQYGLMLPVVLAVSGRWRCFASAAATATLLTVATVAVFGTAVWHAFFVFSEFTRTVVLEQGNTGWYKIQSVFAWARTWGASVALAYALQGAAIVMLAVALAWLWRSAAAFSLKAAALCLTTILATPYSLDYDMMVLAPAIAFLAADGLRRGFAPWEKTALAALWLAPLVARSVGEASLIPLGVPAMLWVFALVLRRAARDIAVTGFDRPTALSGVASS
jgi:alpha-1,2-mannosyltransferase